MSLRTFFSLQTSLARVKTVLAFTAEDPWNANLLSSFTLDDYQVTVLNTDQPSNFSKDRLLAGFFRALHSSADGAVHVMPESMVELWETGQLPVEALPGLLKAIEPKLIENDYRPVMHSPLIKGLAYFHAVCFAFIELMVFVGVTFGHVPVLIGGPVALGAGFLCWAALRYLTHFGKFMRRWSQMKWLLALHHSGQAEIASRLAGVASHPALPPPMPIYSREDEAMALPIRTDAAFTQFLVDHGLAAAGTDETWEDLRLRYGISPRPDSAKIIELPASSLFPEQIGRYYIAWDSAVLAPPLLFQCDFRLQPDAMQNFDLALSHFTRLFGDPKQSSVPVTVSAEWKFEQMWLRIWIYRKEGDPFGKRGAEVQRELYAKNPELWDVCHIWIHRTPRHEMTQSDADRLNALEAGEIFPVEPSRIVPKAVVAGWWFLWKSDGISLKPRQAPFLWKDRETLGLFFEEGIVVFPRDPGMKLQHERALPAKGGGYSVLDLVAPREWTLDHELYGHSILAGPNVDSLDEVAAKVAAFWELPLSVETGYDA